MKFAPPALPKTGKSTARSPTFFLGQTDVCWVMEYRPASLAADGSVYIGGSNVEHAIVRTS